MGIRFFCPNGHKLHVKEFQAGRRGICPHCGVSMDIPLTSTRPSSKKRAMDAASVDGDGSGVVRVEQHEGEPIALESRMTELSGGQTRALLIADATIICNTPIVLLDEVENAGIHPGQQSLTGNDSGRHEHPRLIGHGQFPDGGGDLA